MISIPLYLDTEHDCSYLTEHKSQFAYIHPEFQLTTKTYSQLIEQGFRRSGSHVYQPYCTNCQKCVPARLAIKDFQASRQQRRTLKKNADLQVIIKPAQFESAHFELYQQYQRSRHTEGNMADANAKDYINFLSSHWCNTLFVEFSCSGELAGVAVVDLLDNALSAVYTFFDPKFSQRSLGVYAVLWQIEHAKTLGLEWLYLGYWIADCQKMSYKINYQPLQGLIDHQWQMIKK
jgi:arginine-tRNA-protein transferase